MPPSRLYLALLLGAAAAAQQLPVAWTTYRKIESTEKDYADLKAHGVGAVTMGTRSVADVREALDTARRLGMKYLIDFPEVTENAGLVRHAGLQPVEALMIGGVFQGKAIDRHIFRFTAAKHKIVIEPPVYNKGFAYTLGSGGTGPKGTGEPFAHYFPDLPAPVRAEIVVPLAAFDGRRHLKIIPATIELAPPATKPEIDSVTSAMPASSEIVNRKLYTVEFDLTGLDKAMLDRTGIAVYWPSHGSPKYWMFGRGNVSAAADTTREALRRDVRRILGVWTEANGGKFPSDVVIASRWGDECFYTTGHTGPDSPAVSYPLWDYSKPSIETFRKHAGNIDYPRTWGYPEIYGADSYAWWMYTLHENCARLAGDVHEEVAKFAPGLLVFRNTTRNGVFDLSNDHDGSAPELLTRHLDVVHLDPYPVQAAGYSSAIPRDMSYYGGLARRYHRPLVPWMQAHTYGGPTGLQDPTPADIDRMAEEQWKQGGDVARLRKHIPEGEAG